MNIFVSRPTWVSAEFSAGLEVFLTSLQNQGLVPRTLGSSDYPSKAPLDEVIEIMDECNGAIILGYPQLTVTTGKIKESDISNELLLATEWNHIEAALAYSKELPILCIHHTGVSRGVFDRGVMNAFIHEANFTSATWSMDKAFNGALQKWKNNCAAGNSNFITNSTPSEKLPTCPNCSTKHKPIYMSHLSDTFRDFGEWRCTICNFIK